MVAEGQQVWVTILCDQVALLTPALSPEPYLVPIAVLGNGVRAPWCTEHSLGAQQEREVPTEGLELRELWRAEWAHLPPSVDSGQLGVTSDSFHFLIDF